MALRVFIYNRPSLYYSLWIAWCYLLVPTLVSCVFVLRNLVGAILGLPYQTVGNGGGKSGVLGVDSELLYATTDDRKDWAGPIWGYVLAQQTTRTLHRYKNVCFSHIF